MCFDEKGQADTYERRIEVARRAYDLLVDKVGFPPEDIVIDPNVFAIATVFDEKGQADTYERRIEVARRAYDLLVDKVGFPPEDIVIDPNVFAIATGIDEHANYAVDFIRTAAWIKQHLPHAKISGGISNVSFSFRGNDSVRAAIHTVFLYHAIRAGLTMGIVNAGQLGVYDELDPELRERVE